MTRRGSSDCGNDYHSYKQMRGAYAHCKNNFNDGTEGMQRRKRRKTYNSADSAESDVVEEVYAQNTNERKKQRRHATTRVRHQDAVESEMTKKKEAHDKYRNRIERKSAAPKRRRYVDDGSSVSDTETLTVTETSDASSSGSKNSRCHRNATKYRSYDDIVYNSDGVNFTKCRRNISTERLKPPRFTVMQNYAPHAKAEGWSPTTHESQKCANEMLQFMNNLFRSLGNTSSSIVINKTDIGVRGGGGGYGGATRQPNVSSRGGMTQMQNDECNKHGAASPENHIPCGASDAYGAMGNSRAQLANAGTSTNPQNNPQEMESTEETRPRNYYVTHNETASVFPQAPPRPHTYKEQSISKIVPLQAQSSDYGIMGHAHKYALPHYAPQSQAKFAPKSQLNFVPTLMECEKNSNSYAPLAMTQAYLASHRTTPTTKFAPSPLPTHSTSHNTYAPQTQFTNHNTYAPQNQSTSNNAYAPQNQSINHNAYAPQYFPPNNTQTQENMFPQSVSPTMHQTEAATRVPLPPIQTMEYMDDYRNIPERYVLTDVPLVPQLDSHITHENLLDVTYITPRPTEMRMIEEKQNADELEAPQDNLTDPSAVADVIQVEDQTNATNETDSYEAPMNTDANANTNALALSGNISRKQMIAQADQRIHFPIIANRVQENLNYATNNNDNVRVATNDSENTRNQQDNTNPEANAEEDTKIKKGAKEKHRKNSNKGKKHERHDESSGEEEEETSSACSSDYVRECLRKKKRKRKYKNDGAEKRYSHTKKRKHSHRGSYGSDDSFSDSDQSSANYSQRSRYSGSRGRSKRHSGKQYEPYTPSGSESDDEMDYRYSKTSCKCCSRSRIVAICRIARDSAGTQTDECCGCCCDCSARTKRSSSQAECNSKLERDLQRTICEGLTNADQNTLRKIMELNSDKGKKCKVCTCGTAGERCTPELKSDMIIIKFEENEKNSNCDTLEQQKCACIQEHKCKVTESESELIQALIRKKRVFEKIQKACSITKISSDSCDCICAPVDEAEVEHEFMEDLLRRQRQERSKQCAANNCNDCPCEVENKAKELAANVMTELIRNHIRSMCAAELANQAKSVECACNESCAEEDESLSSESCAECLCDQPKKRDVGVGDISVMQPCDCTCGAKESLKIPQRLATLDRCSVSPTRSERRFGKQKENQSAESVRFSTENRFERDCTCCRPEKNEYKPTKQKSAAKTTKRTSSHSSGVSLRESGSMNMRAACCPCKPSKNELRALKEREKPEKIIEIKISAISQGSVRDDRRDARGGNCTCKTPMQITSTPKSARDSQLKQARSAHPKSARNARRSLENEYTDDSEASRSSMRADNCTCLATQKAEQARKARSLNKEVSGNAAVSSGNRNTREDKAKNATKRISRIPLPKANVNKSNACRQDCACNGADSPSESGSDCEELPRSAARNSKTCPPCACNDKITDNIKSETKRSSKLIRAMSKDTVEACRPDCACRQRVGGNKDSELNEFNSQCALARRKPCLNDNNNDDDDDDGDSASDDSGHKSIQKLIIDIKASKQARASCTLITYPKSSKNAEVYKSLVEQSISAGGCNEQRAAICAELTMNNLLPEQSLRTLLTKLSSPEGKLFYDEKLQAKLPEEDINTFSLDQSKVLSLKKGRNGKMKPTMIMSQAIRVTGNKPTTAATADAGLAPLQYFKNKLLKISCSAPSVVTSQVLAADGSSKSKVQKCAEHAERKNPKTWHAEERSSKQKVKKSLIPLPLERRLGGRHSNNSKLFTLPQSESAEARANTRPLIDQTSDLNHHITRLWPAKAGTAQQQKYEKKKTQRNKEKSLTTNMIMKSQSNIEFALAKNAGFYSNSARPRLESGTTQREFKKSSSSSSNDAHFVPSQIKSKKKYNNNKLSEQKSPPKMVNILDAANRSHIYAQDSSESYQSNPAQLPDSKYKSALQQKVNRKKRSAKELPFDSPQTYSFESIGYIPSQDSAAISRTNNNAKDKKRVTRFSISDDELSDSDVECCSLVLKDSQSDQYQVYLQRKQQLWRRGTVKKALEVEEEESERTNRHWQRTTLTGECLERAIHYPTSVWNEERRQLNLKRNGGSLFGTF